MAEVSTIRPFVKGSIAASGLCLAIAGLLAYAYRPTEASHQGDQSLTVSVPVKANSSVKADISEFVNGRAKSLVLVLANDTQDVVELTRVRATCICVATLEQPVKLAPGAAHAITVDKLRVDNDSEEFAQLIEVTTSVGPIPITLHGRNERRELLQCFPRTLTFDDGAAATERFLAVKVTAGAALKCELSSTLAGRNGLAIEVHGPNRIGMFDHYRVRVSVSAPAEAMMKGELHLSTDFGKSVIPIIRTKGS